LIMIHLPAWRAGVVRRLMPSYGLAFLSGGIAFIGVVGVIELLYRQVAFGVPWVGSALMLLIGGFFLPRTTRAVRKVWEDLSPELARWS